MNIKENKVTQFYFHKLFSNVSIVSAYKSKQVGLESILRLYKQNSILKVVEQIIQSKLPQTN